MQHPVSCRFAVQKKLNTPGQRRTVRAVGFIPVTPRLLGKGQQEGWHASPTTSSLPFHLVASAARLGVTRLSPLVARARLPRMSPLRFTSRDAARRRPFRMVAALISVAALGYAGLIGCGGGNKQQTSETSSGTSTPPSGGQTTSTASTTTSDTAAVRPAIAPTPTSATDGATIFKEKCAICHGPDGHGNGPLSPSLNPKPRNFHDKAYMATRTRDQLRQSVYNGKSQMPPWGKSGALKDAQIDAVLDFVLSLSKKP